MALSHLAPLLYGALAFVAFWVLKLLYRISPLHPLAKIPGPKLPALSTYYEFHQNVVKDGQFLNGTKTYGPVVRIGPNEVHVAEPSFYNILYTKEYKFNKAQKHYYFAQQKEGGVGNMNSHTNKLRRGVLDPLFSTQSVMKLEPRIQTYVDKVMSRISRAENIDRYPINDIFRCLTVDVISEYAYSEPIGLLENEDLNHPFFQSMDDLIGLTWFYNWTPWMQDFLAMLPFWMVKKIMPASAMGVLDFQKQAHDRVLTFLADPEKAKAKSTHTTVFEVLLQGDEKKGYEVPSVNALKEECWGFLAAGSETTAAALTNGVWEVCKNPEIQERLYNELCAEFPDPENDPITYKRTLKLAYLTGFIKEILRTPPGVPGRLPRVIPKGGIQVSGLYLPETTIVGMSSIMQMNDPSVYKNPELFDPERWSRDKIPEQFFVPFSKGARGCQGMNLAWAELFLMFAALFRKYKFELHKDSTYTDHWTDQFIPKREGKLLVNVIERE